MEAMQTMQKEMKSKKPLTITVSPWFVNVSTEERVYIIIFPKPNKTFYLKPDHIKALVTMAVARRKILNPAEDGDWVEGMKAHLMIIVPERSMYDNISTDPNNGGPWVMWSETPYAHIMVPIDSYPK